MQALYRKYRSKSFAEVVGQEHVTDTLSLALKKGQTTHAYLFTGPKGTGKTSVARILAHELNELPYSEGAQNLDIIEIDAASNRRIDDVRDLRDKVHIAPVSARYKVYIIDEVHMLTSESFNALLKTLEEPPQHVVFILATTEVHKLPATIVSRTQRFHFRPVARERVMAHLKYIAAQEKVTVDEEALALIAEYGEGSFRDSISLLDQLAVMSGGTIKGAFVESSLGLAAGSQITHIVSLLISGSRAELHSLLNDLENRGVDAIVLTKQLIRQLKDAAMNRPEFYLLIDQLLDVQKSPQPGTKLLVTLLSSVGAATLQTQPSPVSPKSDLPGSRPAVRKSVASKAALNPVTPPSRTDIISEDLTPDTAKDIIGNTNETKPPLTIAHWSEVLSSIKLSNPPLFSILKGAEPRFEADILTLAFSFKLHSIKLDDSRYRTKLAECISQLGYRCPMISVVHDAAAVSPTISLAEALPVATDETASSVLAMMGGGEVVNA